MFHLAPISRPLSACPKSNLARPYLVQFGSLQVYEYPRTQLLAVGQPMSSKWHRLQRYSHSVQALEKEVPGSG